MRPRSRGGRLFQAPADWTTASGTLLAQFSLSARQGDSAMKAGPIARLTPGILVVDDNEDMLESMRMVLERAGYEVDTASSGERAVLLQRERPADVLITDIFMPDTSGMELIGQFKHEFPAVRIIAM